MRGHRFLDQRRQRHPIERLAGGQLGDLGEDFAAALRLLAQQLDVVRVGRLRIERALNLPYDKGDGGKRRAELMRRSGRQAIELREMLLARQHELGRRKRIRELTSFFGYLPRIDPDVADREQDGEPHRD